MKKRKIFLLILSMAILVIMAGCGNKNAGIIENTSDLEGKVVGMISSSVPTEIVEGHLTKTIGGEPADLVYFNRRADGVTAVITGKVDAMMAPDFVADYYVKKNENLKMIDYKEKGEGGSIMVVRSEDQQLKEDLDKAITALQEDGTLKKLEDEWISNLPADNEPSNKNIQKIEGAETVYVGVCGDMAPLDYIAADGRPAGYNVALLTEVGKLLNINFEFVSMESQVRFTALNSKKIDVIFCHFKADNTSFLEEFKNNNWVGTKSYYKFNGVSLLIRK